MRPIKILLLVMLVLANAVPAAAQDDYHFATSVVYEYASQLDFEVTIFAPERITRAAVSYRPVSGQDTEIVYADLTETGVGAFHGTASIDLRQNPLPPFTTIEYQWQLELADGGSHRSPTYEFRYFDNRFDWQTLSGNDVSVYWVEGDLELGQAALDLAIEARFEIAFDLGLTRVSPTEIFIYPSQWQLQSALGLGNPAWLGGHADPANGSILLFAPNDPEYRIVLETDIPHEMTHLLLHELMGSQGYQNLPGWLNEGLASNPAAPDRLEEAYHNQELLDFVSLCGAFPYAEDEAVIAYLQSQSFVGYLQDRYGNKSIDDLLHAYEDRVSCQAGVETVYGQSLEELSHHWQRDVLGASGISLQLQGYGSWMMMALPLVIVLVMALVAPWRETRSSG
jgi:hypothetical protein